MSFSQYNSSGIKVAGSTPTGEAGLAIDGNAKITGDHLVNTSNPHGVTAHQAGAYTQAEVDTALATKASASALATTNSALATTNTNVAANTTAIAAKLDKSGGALTGVVTTSANIGATNSTWHIDPNGNAVFNAEVDMGSAVVGGFTYIKSDLKVWNKAHNGWLVLASRDESGSEAVYNLDHIGSLVCSKSAVTGVVAVTANGNTTIPLDAGNQVNLTLTASSTITSITGTPNDGQGLLLRATSTGSDWTLGFDTTYFRVPSGITVPVTVPAGSTVYVTCVWNSFVARFDVLGVLGGF